jgi:DNA replication protein DnaC
MSKKTSTSPASTLSRSQQINAACRYLKLSYLEEHWSELLQEGVTRGHSPEEHLEHCLSVEVEQKQTRAVARRIKQARFPVIKTLESFDWNWPKTIDQDHVRHLFSLNFLKKSGNVMFIGNVGLGKTHLASALGYHACEKGQRVRFMNTMDMINHLEASSQRGQMTNALKGYLSVELLILDELGYLPIDQRGADLLFQVISGRYEQGSTIITSNKAYKDWVKILNNDAGLTSAMLDRLLHRSETVMIEGKSYRMKDRID